MFNPDTSNVYSGELEDVDPLTLGYENADTLLANDPEFMGICDARRDDMIEAMEDDCE
jgi:hypothetical protein